MWRVRHCDGGFFLGGRRYGTISILEFIALQIHICHSKRELSSSDMTFFAFTDAPCVRRVGCGLGRVLLALHRLPMVVHVEYLLDSGIFTHFAGFFYKHPIVPHPPTSNLFFKSPTSH